MIPEADSVQRRADVLFDTAHSHPDQHLGIYLAKFMLFTFQTKRNQGVNIHSNCYIIA